MLIAGCDRQRDLYLAGESLIEVSGDWIPSLGKDDMSMDATALAFGADRKIVKAYFYDPHTVDIPLTRGTYDVMLFNGLMYSETDTHLDEVYFRGTDRLDTFEAVASEGKSIKRLGTRAEAAYVASNDMEIVTSALQSIDVDGSGGYRMKYRNGKEILDTDHDNIYKELSMTPVALSYETQVVVRIKNISSAAGASAALYGFVGSAFMASRMPSDFYVTHQFGLNNRRTIDEALDIGTIESPVFVSFGPPLNAPDNRYEIYIKMALVDGREIERSFDVSEQMAPIVEEIKTNFESGTTIHYRLEIPLEIELELPVVEPVEGSLGIDGWADDELIRVPMTS